ncbi:Lrp/AsnC family transcriptional regulator [Marinomonas ostreistagni]|uniref:Lrp/AsnC family transcriptional regulator n=1 Tax=Marinomonas ostreistagni TaxID=359209 RepID=A0ABS0ZFC5_9GAMM|nr:Lrp/AsnC family transcriptional regulator [Marinomonas ostreistagni]MBJ7552374.1 Lrp/AsnC family transcriptional regulator [Marinomonas ostreistagni]
MQQPALDRYDISILNLLQQNSQIPRIELAEQIGLSSSQCFRRIKRLEEEGVIDHYVAVVNKKKVGIDVSAVIMVQYRKSEVDARKRTIELIQNHPLIHECHSITGEDDFMLHVYCKTMEEFNHLINDTLQASFISGLHTYMLLSSIKSKQALQV